MLLLLHCLGEFFCSLDRNHITEFRLEEMIRAFSRGPGVPFRESGEPETELRDTALIIFLPYLMP